MPQYSFLCDTDYSGCGCSFSISIPMADYKKATKALICPECECQHIYRDYDTDANSIQNHHTLGMFAAKRTAKMSSDELHHLKTTQNAYKTGGSKFESTPDGNVRKKT